MEEKHQEVKHMSDISLKIVGVYLSLIQNPLKH